MEEILYYPLTPDRWADFEVLFGERGAYSGCWCMWWRMSSADWNKSTRSERKASMQEIVKSGQIPGILAYAGDRPVGWCSVGPREAFTRIERSRKLIRLDEEITWSVNCFYVDKAYRGQGMMSALLKAATEYAISQGAQIVEGYPVNDKEAPTAPVNIYTGVSSIFREGGFDLVEREVGGKLIKRYIYRGN